MTKLYQQHNVFCLCAPTAMGKTSLAIELAKQLPISIISVDSAKIYKGMDIGTAKPDPKTLKKYPHKLVDIIEPTQIYSVGDFVNDVEKEIKESWASNRVPFLVGGTMMYFNALRQGLASLPPKDDSIRKEISLEAEQIGWKNVHAKLKEIDLESFVKINPNDKQRIQRALEVYYLTKKPISAMQKKPVLEKYKLYSFVLFPETREHLHNLIKQRFGIMLEKGFVEEVESLYKRGNLDLTLPSIRSVGYRQIWQYLEGCYSYDDMKEKSIIATRQLAKRQITWLRAWHDLIVLEQDQNKAINSIRKLIMSETK